MPIREWFWTAYLVSTHTPGLSAKQLQRQLGCSYKTAWYMLHRLRRGMVNETRSPLQGLVEADETIIGGPVKGFAGRGVTAAETKTLVLGAVEVLRWQKKGQGWQERAGRIRLAPADRADAETIGRFLRANVAAGTEIRTDGWQGYSKSAMSGYQHDASPGQRARHIHRAFGNLKTWLAGTHHGVDPKYLSHYLDEYVFRFNRRTTPMAAFQTLLGLTATRTPLGYRALTEPESTG
jgi:transposase-like protein